MWDIWRREDLRALRDYLTSHASEFLHNGQPVCSASLDDVIHSQVFLTPLLMLLSAYFCFCALHDASLSQI